MKSLLLGGRQIGEDHPTFVVAELSANHNNSYAQALETVAAAAEAGADAIKLQTYRPDTITFPSSSQDFVVTGDGKWKNRTLFDLYTEGMTPWEWHAPLFEEAKRLGLEAFSSPFDSSAVDFLEALNVPAYKIASFEITDIPLIEQVARLGKPVIISTGIASLQDIELANETCRKVGNDQIIFLKCTSAYPAPLGDLNLLTIADLRERFSSVVGFSDHTLSATASVTAVALGARVIERHITLDPVTGGLDAHFSADPIEFAQMVRMIREVELALGSVTYSLNASAVAARRYARSLYVVTGVKRGDLVTKSNVKSIRPSFGLHPQRLSSLVGRRFAQDVLAGTALTDNLLD